MLLRRGGGGLPGEGTRFFFSYLQTIFRDGPAPFFCACWGGASTKIRVFRSSKQAAYFRDQGFLLRAATN